MSSVVLNISLDSQEAKQLLGLVQAELARRTWSSGEDDEVMSEYILVMVANRKTPTQIVAELRDLIGEGDESDADVDDFVAWMWKAGEQITGRRQAESTSSDVDSSQAVQGSPHHSQRQRRSASPEARQKDSEPSRDQRHQAASDRWASDHHDHPPHRRELLSGNKQQNGWSMASDSMQSGSNHQQSLHRDSRARRRSPRNGNQEIFRKSLQQAQRSDDAFASCTTQQQPSLSIFARAGVPNPRAAEFVPQNISSATQPTSTTVGPDSLLFRLDPMLPTNAPATTQEVGASSYMPEEYPAQPTQTALCRWGVKCTAPTCVYSHPSPSAVTLARRTGEEPLVLRQDPCYYQKDCTRAECEFSHVSPAIKFVLAKADRAATLAFGGGGDGDDSGDPNVGARAQTDQSVPKSKLDTPLGQGGSDASATPCRYGAACYRKDCYFAHPADRAAHVSERLKTFSTDANDGEMEVIIPVA